eukprot:gene1268-1345_t
MRGLSLTVLVLFIIVAAIEAVLVRDGEYDQRKLLGEMDALSQRERHRNKHGEHLRKASSAVIGEGNHHLKEVPKNKRQKKEENDAEALLLKEMGGDLAGGESYGGEE